MSVAEKTFPAAVVREKGGRFELEQVSLGKPQHNEVVVRIVATGICHTDMVARDGDLPVPQPIVLGHEGAGVIGCPSPWQCRQCGHRPSGAGPTRDAAERGTSAFLMNTYQETP